MPYAVAPPLIAGLALRTFLTRVILASPPSTIDTILTGALQGIAWYHVFAQQPPEFSALLGVAIVAKIAFDLFVWDTDTQEVVTSVLGMLLGVLVLDMVTRFLETTELPPPAPRVRKISLPRPRHERTVQFRRSVSPDHLRERDRFGPGPGPGRRVRRMESLENSIITAPSLDFSLPSISEVTDSTHKSSLPPLEREIKELRTRASLADTERRRFREEKKWAESQGNTARAEQMKWNIKRYTALMESFNREADRKLIEGALQQQAGPKGSGHMASTDSKSKSAENKSSTSSSGPIFILPPR
jgi:hypothetical protein